MQTNFSRALAQVLVYEGGRVEDPRDPGGRTNKGVTQFTFNAYLRENNLPAADVYAITLDEVIAIYKTRYWGVVHGDDLPSGLDLVVFDAAVNSGPAQAGKWLQRALGDKFTGVVDGLLGPLTLQAVEDYGDVETLVNVFCAHRLATLRSLRTWPSFGRGWDARIANVMKTADAWCSGADAPAPVDVTSIGGHKKAPVSDIKVSRIGQAAAHATTVATGAGAAASSAAGQLGPVQAQFPHWQWLTYAISALTIVSIAAGIIVKIISDTRAAAAAGTAVAKVNPDADAGLARVAATVPVVTPTP